MVYRLLYLGVEWLAVAASAALAVLAAMDASPTLLGAAVLGLMGAAAARGIGVRAAAYDRLASLLRVIPGEPEAPAGGREDRP